MPEDMFVESGATQPHSHAIGESTSESSVQEPSSNLGESGQRAQSSDGNGQQDRPAQGKHESRYERTKRERAEFKSQQAQFRAQQEAFAMERAQFEESKKPKREYTVADLKKYRGQWASEGNYDLVEKADKEIEVMEAEAEAARRSRTVELPPLGTPEHRAEWHRAEQELYQSDPEFRPGSNNRLDQRILAVMRADGDIYRQHPRGIVAAYHRARMELLQEDNSKLKAELQRLTGLTSIDGGAIGRMGSGGRVESVEDFARLSTRDMRKELMRGAKRGSTPWF